jgi:23S rRNA (adenine2030-N6)-methyltransferase
MLKTAAEKCQEPNFPLPKARKSRRGLLTHDPEQAFFSLTDYGSSLKHRTIFYFDARGTGNQSTAAGMASPKLRVCELFFSAIPREYATLPPPSNNDSTMLSYRHAFHAGNHADVLKHFVLVQLCRHLGQKDKPFWVIDTHAGAGLYELDTGYATQLKEYADGIGRLWTRQDLPAELADYVDQVRACNPDDSLRFYPGSPWLALQTLRPQDRLRLFELHSSDSKILQDNFQDQGRQVSVTTGNGYNALKALLPPPPRRALVLIDPPYETRDDYSNVISALREGLTRFATGTYAVWYPQLARQEARQLPDKLKHLPIRNWLHVTLTVHTPSADGFGMHGSGMFIINPPWTLHQTLEGIMPYLVRVLGQDAGAGFTLSREAD